MKISTSNFRLTIHIYLAIASVLIVLAMTMLDGTLVNVALPILAQEFSVSDSTAVWIVTIYQLVLTMLMLPLSYIGDLYSYINQRSVFTIGWSTERKSMPYCFYGFCYLRRSFKFK